MTDDTVRVLLLDDESSLREPLADYLRNRHGYVVDATANGIHAFSLLEEIGGDYDVAIVDEVLAEGPSGLEVLKEIKRRHPEVEVILLTAWGTDSFSEAQEAGAFRCFSKPFSPDHLALAVHYAAYRRRSKREQQMLSTLNHVSAAISATVDFDEIARLTCRSAVELIGVDHSNLVMFDWDDLIGRVNAEYPEEGFHTRGTVIPIKGIPAEERLAYHKEILNIPDIASDDSLGEVRNILASFGIRSILIVPVVMRGIVIGSFSLDSIKQRTFLKSEEELCQNLAAQVAIAIDKAQLFRRWQALSEAGEALRSTLNLNEVTERILQLALSTFPQAERGSIHLYDERTGYLHLLSHTHRFKPAAIKALDLKPGEGISGWVYQYGEGVVLDNTGQDPRYKRVEHPDVPTHKSMVCVPLRTKEQGVIGTLNLSNIHATSVFRQDDLEWLSAFANHAAIAIDNARLYRETQEGRDYLGSLYEASIQLISPNKPEELLRDIVERAREATGAQRVEMLLFDEAMRPRLVTTSDKERKLDLATVIRPNGISTQVIRTGLPYFLSNTAALNESMVLNPNMVSEGIQAAACIPMSLRGRNIGVLWFQFDDTHTFSETEQKALQLFGNQSAIAYDNARRMYELEHMRDAVESIASAAGILDVLQRIATSVKEVLRADSSLIWSYDEARDRFFPEELIAAEIPDRWLERFRNDEPEAGRTTRRVLEQGYISITDITLPESEFIGSRTREFLVDLGVKSFQGICLEVGNEKLGVLFVDYKDIRAFDNEDRRILETFANHATLALKKARLSDQVRKARDAAAVVAQVSALAKDVEETLDSITKAAQSALGCDVVTLYRYNMAVNEFEYPPAMVGVRYPERVKLLPGINRDSIIWEVLENNELIIVEDADSHPLTRQRRFTVEEEIKSLAGIPLSARGKKVGVLFINYRSEHRFTNDELNNLTLFANQAAVAIHNAQLYREIAKRTEALEALYDAGMAITSTLSLETTLSEITRHALRIIGSNYQDKGCFSHVALFENDTLWFVAANSPDILDSLQQMGTINLENSSRIGIWGRAIKEKQSVYIRNVHDPSQTIDYIPLETHINSQLSVPIMIGDQCIGVLSIEHPHPNAFTTDDQRNVEALAAQAAIAIKNARLYQELNRTKTQMAARTALAWAGMMSSTWRHTIEKHAVTIREQIQLLRLGSTKGQKFDTAGERLTIIERLANKILEKPLTPPLGIEEGAESVYIDQLIRERTKQLWTNDPYRTVKLNLELGLRENVTVRSSPEWLRRALDILVDNAVESTADQAQPKITFITRDVGDQAEISIVDNGKGIAEDVRSKILREPIAKLRDTKGLGMGLLFAQVIVQTYGGEIQVGSTGPTGTKMVILLPSEKQ